MAIKLEQPRTSIVSDTKLVKQIFALNEATLTELAELDHEHVYVFEVELPFDMTREQVYQYCHNLGAILKEHGIKAIILPNCGGSNITISKLTEYAEAHKEIHEGDISW